jgi:hypothetical protein
MDLSFCPVGVPLKKEKRKKSLNKGELLMTAKGNGISSFIALN